MFLTLFEIQNLAICIAVVLIHLLYSNFLFLYLILLQFDFNPVILDWWLNQGPRHWLRPACMDTAYCIGARVGVTNTSSPCHALDFGVWWSLCLPCYCVLAFSYKIWRSLICQIWDYYYKIDGDVEVVLDIRDLKIYDAVKR